VVSVYVVALAGREFGDGGKVDSVGAAKNKESARKRVAVGPGQLHAGGGQGRSAQVYRGRGADALVFSLVDSGWELCVAGCFSAGSSTGWRLAADISTRDSSGSMRQSLWFETIGIQPSCGGPGMACPPKEVDAAEKATCSCA